LGTCLEWGGALLIGQHQESDVAGGLTYELLLSVRRRRAADGTVPHDVMRAEHITEDLLQANRWRSGA
jgi:hypothetical protein